MKRGDLLRGDRGFALVDTMIGVIVVAVTILGLIAAATSAGQSVRNVSVAADRLSYLRTTVNDLALDPGAVSTAPSSRSVAIADDQVIVTTWAVVTGSVVEIHAATSRTRDTDGSECADPAALGPRCIEGQVTTNSTDPTPAATAVPTTWTPAAVATTTGASVAASQVASFTVPAGDAKVRFVVKVSGASAAGNIVFRAGSNVIKTIPFTTATNGYLSGDAIASGGTAMTVTTDGGPVTLTQLLIYEEA